MGRETWARKQHKTRAKIALSMKSISFSIGRGVAGARKHAPKDRWDGGRVELRGKSERPHYSLVI